MVCKEIIYYTDNELDPHIMEACQSQIASIGLPIISSSLNGAIDFGDNEVFNGKRSYLSMFRQIVNCLERCRGDVVFFCEHDVFYHESHFDFIPERDDVYYYNNNAWKWNGFEAVKYDSRWLSQLCCYRKIAINHYRKKVHFEKDGIKKRFEPGSRRGIDKLKSQYWESEYPNIDIRHGKNLTGVSRFSLDTFRKRKPNNFIKKYELPKGVDRDALLCLI